MRKLVLIPVALSICMSMGGCPKLRDLSYDHDNDEKEIAYDFHQEFEYQVQDGTVQHGIISDGNAIAVVPQTEPQSSGALTTPSYPPDTPVSSDQLVGSWNTVRRSDTYLYSYYIEFYADGTFSQGESEYTHTKYHPEMFYEQPEGWHPVPMGFPYWYGTYTVEGNVITMTTLGDSIEEYSDPIVNTLTVQSVSDSEAVFNDTRYIKNFKPTDSDKLIEELCALMGVDLSI